MAIISWLERLRFKFKNNFKLFLDNSFIFNTVKHVWNVFLSACFLSIWIPINWKLGIAALGFYGAWIAFKNLTIKYASLRGRGED